MGLVPSTNKLATYGELHVEVISASSLKDPEYRLGDFVKKTMKKAESIRLYVTITFGDQIKDTTVVETTDTGNVSINQRLVFLLNKEVTGGELMIRAYDKREQSHQVKGHPLIGKARIVLRPPADEAFVEEVVELERSTSRQTTSFGNKRRSVESASSGDERRNSSDGKALDVAAPELVAAESPTKKDTRHGDLRIRYSIRPATADVMNDVGVCISRTSTELLCCTRTRGISLMPADSPHPQQVKLAM
mmetsp:Transcript_101473/g.160452  ORF Transcript_101473/g.160452 Transcript_101473/m.160452 type:complete len:248 (+) Transcript_101473:53-796(+)